VKDNLPPTGDDKSRTKVVWEEECEKLFRIEMTSREMTS